MESEDKGENLNTYIDRLMDEMREMFERSKQWSKIEMATMLALIIAIILTSNPWIWLAGFNLWIFTFIYRSMRVDLPLSKKFGEIDGVFNTLRILGILKDDEPSGKKDKETKEQKMAFLERVKETWGKIRMPQLQPQVVRIKNDE